MSEDRDVWLKSAAALLDLTQQGTLKWQSLVPPASMKVKESDVIEIAFTTRYRGKKLRLYKRIYEAQRPIKDTSPFSSLTRPQLFGFDEPTETYITSEIILEFLSPDNLVLWKFPHVSVLSDLLSAVQYQTAGVKDFLQDILDGKPPEPDR